MPMIDETHDPARKSWVESANVPENDFPIQNLPYGVFSIGGERRIGVAIGHMILDLTEMERSGEITPGDATKVFDRGVLNPFMALSADVWGRTRAALADVLDRDRGDPTAPLVRLAEATLHLPFHVRSFTDFYASRHHAANVGALFRDPEHALPANWLHLPIGYNGRASTVVVGGTAVYRPNGQIRPDGEDWPRFAPSRKLDFELELGAVIGTPNAMGCPVDAAQAYDAIFGYVLLNDWSARDIQTWEYQPLGPFQSKAFATSIGPWVVTRHALEPFRVAAPERLTPLLPYLQEEQPNTFDIALEVALARDGEAAQVISRSNARHLYYSSAVQLVHHASSGCAMETGDLLGSGTISGPTPDSLGSLLEMTRNGRDALSLQGASRFFLEDGDTVILSGRCIGNYRVGFGDCAGRILPAPMLDGWDRAASGAGS